MSDIPDEPKGDVIEKAFEKEIHTQTIMMITGLSQEEVEYSKGNN